MLRHLPGQYLYDAHVLSSRLASFRLNAETGALTALADYEVGKQPFWVMVEMLEG